jgi:hypothetical protein
MGKLFKRYARVLIMPIVGTLLLFSASGPTWSQEQTFSAQSCSYWKDNGPSADGPCFMRTTTINGNFGYILTFGDGTRVTIEYVKSQSGYHIWNINGQRGFGIEITRNSLRGASIDLQQIVEWESGR